MLFWKLASVVLTGIIGIFTYLIEFKWRNRRTTNFRIARNILIALFIAALALSVYLVTFDHYESAEQIQLVTSKLDSLQFYSKSAKDTLAGVKDTLFDVKKILVRVDSQMTPFLSLAMRRYPNTKTDVALGRLAKDITLIFNQKVEVINAPNALIATQNQTGNNTVINTLPPIQVSVNEWKIQNVKVNKIPMKGKDTVNLPHSKAPYNFVYHNQFRISYNSKIARDQVVITLNRKDIIFGQLDIDLSMRQGMMLAVRSNWNTKRDKHLIIISRPQVGYYILDYYTVEMIFSYRADLHIIE